MNATSQQAVARVAYLASDLLVDALPPEQISSLFEDVYADSAGNLTCGVTRVRHGADPGSIVLTRKDALLISLVISSPKDALPQLVPHLANLTSKPLVIHAAVQDDLAPALALRSSVSFVLHSSSAQQAYDHALLASRLARLEQRAVLHIFHTSWVSESISQVDESRIRSFMAAERRRSRTASTYSTIDAVNGHSNGHSYHSNGHQNGGANVNGGVMSGEASPATPSSPTFTLEDSPGLQLYKAYESASLDTLALVRRAVRPLTYSGPPNPSTLLFTLGHTTIDAKKLLLRDVSAVQVSLLSPLIPSKIMACVPTSVSRILVLEQIQAWPTKYTPLFLDIVTAMQQRPLPQRPTIQPGVLGLFPPDKPPGAIDLQKLLNKQPPERLSLGYARAPRRPFVPTVQVPAHESAYTRILSTLFGERLSIENSPGHIDKYGAAATLPEFTLGRVQVQLEERTELVHAVREALDPTANPSSPPELAALLSRWLLAKDDVLQSRALADKIIPLLSATPRLRELHYHFAVPSRWIVGSDAWAYDIGASGLHHLLASSTNLNLLLLDTVPYSRRDAIAEARRKKDAGLYAMNRGNVYVASVAVYASYGQVLQAFVEADRYPGPSIVLAHLPYESDAKVPEPTALQLLKETKLAVDSGYWPLYRWDPSKEHEGGEPFSLDSEALKADLKEFLDRQNHLSQLVRNTPEMAAEIVGSLGENLQEARRRKAQRAYDELVNAMEGPPLLVLYASDGGNAEKIAKRFAARGKMRGLATRVQTLDSYQCADFSQESYVAIITSTAGQGEPPQNGRETFKALSAMVTAGETPFATVKYSVFGMGDSHYWPRPEDAHYYNRPGRDLDTRLEQLGAERFADLGLGDDQDADGPQTGYKIWEPKVWKALGVDTVEVEGQEPEPVTNEHIKIASNYLRGTIKEGLVDKSTGALAPSDGQLTKFHGIYEQDDRDIRDERKDQGLEPAYAFMIRVRMPGGVCRPEQWLAMDRIADERGNGSFKLTTRQTFQFHGVIKRHLKPSIQAINRALLDTIAACGDVNRNVLCTSLPPLKHLHREMYHFAKSLSERLLPHTTAYHEIWLDKKMVAGDAVKDFEPLYGEYYLPRKFKIAVACPPNNDVDIFANDLGFIVIADENERLVGFNVTAGGGMGVTHSNKKTYPRLADVLGFVSVEQAYIVAESVLLTQRDNGNRQDRKNARLKYTIDRMGLQNFKAEVEKRAGFALQPPRPYVFDSNVDTFGWIKGLNGKQHYTIFIENGRVQDELDRDFKTGLREIAKIHQGTFRLTANQHVIIADVPDDQVPIISKLLAKYKLDNLSHSGLRLSSSACVAFPTCGLAMAESERYLPILIDKVEKICEENGLRHDSIIMRMTGCPNGCARPYVAEVAFVGKSPGVYLMLLGGGYYGQRLNKIYRESVTERDILAILRPMIKRYALERLEGERFGDWTIRAGYIAPTTSGKEWYDRAGGEGEHHVACA